MKVIGITGGIASGKSHVLSKVKRMGAYVLDCDSIVRDLSRPGYPLHKAIVNEFGEEYLKEDGTIDKAKLRRTVFSDDAQLGRLNNASKEVILKRIKRDLENAKGYEVVFVEGIRVFEDGFREIFDQIWFVKCSETEQLKRLMERDKILFGHAMEIIIRQRDVAKSESSADVVIDSDCDIAELFKRVEKLYMEIG